MHFGQEYHSNDVGRHTGATFCQYDLLLVILTLITWLRRWLLGYSVVKCNYLVIRILWEDT